MLVQVEHFQKSSPHLLSPSAKRVVLVKSVVEILMILLKLVLLVIPILVSSRLMDIASWRSKETVLLKLIMLVLSVWLITISILEFVKPVLNLM